MERNNSRQRKLSTSATPPSLKSSYYAGARFETTPSLQSLPTPPIRWTMSSPVLRSQSMPSSPITTSMGTTTKVVTTLGIGELQQQKTPTKEIKTPAPVFKSASFPGDNSLMSLFRGIKVPVDPVDNAQVQEAQKVTAAMVTPVKVAQVEEKVDLFQMLMNASPKRIESPVKLIPTATASTRTVIAKPCQLYFGEENDQQHYKDISQHLKTLLKVTA